MMLRARHMLAGAAMTLSLVASSVLAQDPVLDFAPDDPAMQTAIAQAQDSLPRVLSATIGPDGAAHPALSLKVAVAVEGGETTHEVIWVDTVRQIAEGYVALLANDPNFFAGKVGDSLSFEGDQIADWGLWGSDGLLYGHFTTRVLLPRMDAAEARKVSDILAADALPDGWK